MTGIILTAMLSMSCNAQDKPAEPRSRLPVAGNEDSVPRMIADPKKYAGKTLILAGGAEISDYYNYQFAKSQDKYYSISFTQLTPDWVLVPQGQITLYLDRSSGAPFVNALAEKHEKGYLKAVRVKIVAAFYEEKKGVPIEPTGRIFAWQFLTDDGKDWTDWQSGRAGPKSEKPEPRANEKELIQAANDENAGQMEQCKKRGGVGCDGRGYRECFECKGEGTETCKRCGGTGKMTVQVRKQRGTWSIAEKEKRPCTECERGKQRCAKCGPIEFCTACKKPRGGFPDQCACQPHPTTTVRRGFIPCPRCKGTGNLAKP